MCGLGGSNPSILPGGTHILISEKVRDGESQNLCLGDFGGGECANREEWRVCAFTVSRADCMQKGSRAGQFRGAKDRNGLCLQLGHACVVFRELLWWSVHILHLSLNVFSADSAHSQSVFATSWRGVEHCTFPFHDGSSMQNVRLSI